jgi:hypothetical protein
LNSDNLSQIRLIIPGCKYLYIFSVFFPALSMR